VNLTDAGNTHGIIIDLVIEKGYRVRLDIDYADDAIINYWQGIKENKMVQTKDPANLLGLILVTENEPTGSYPESILYQQKALEYAKSKGYTVEKMNGDYRASKPESKLEYIYGITPLSLVSMIYIAEKYGTDWQQHINLKNYDAIIDESCFEMQIEDLVYINGRGCCLCGKVKEGRVYRGTTVRILSSERDTIIPYLVVDDLPVFGWIHYAEKGDNIGLNFAYPKTTEEIKAAFPIKKGDWVYYANYNIKTENSKPESTI